MKITYMFLPLLYYCSCKNQEPTMLLHESHFTEIAETHDPFEYELGDMIVYENTVYTELLFNELVYDNKSYRALVKCEFDLKMDSIVSLTIKRCGIDVYLGSSTEEMNCTISIIRAWLQENVFDIEQNI